MTSVKEPQSACALEWDLSDLYSDSQAWQDDRSTLEDAVSRLEGYRGRLGDSPAVLKEALELLSDIRKRMSRLYSYASLLSDTDTRESEPQGMKQAITQQWADLAARTAWIDPEILALRLDPEAVEELVEAEPGLVSYTRHLERLEKRRAHTLDAEGERILGMTSLLTGSGQTVGSLLRNAEIPWRTVTLSDGQDLRVDSVGFSRGRTLPERQDRVLVFKTFFQDLNTYRQTLAALLASTTREHVFEARVRNYAHTLEASLAPDEIPVSVYDMLTREVERSLPVLHRYLHLRARLLDMDDLAYHDLYAPLVDRVEAVYSWERSKDLVLEAFAPMGSHYVEKLNSVLEKRWVDVLPRLGKRAGAYVSGDVYDVHPYMLLNHQDNHESLTTLAHEIGHLMHSLYSNEAQPYPTAGYSTFVAEVASTTAEWLLFRHLADAAVSSDERLSILGSFLESIRTTVFRQTLFATFERSIHSRVEKGEPLTADGLDGIYLELLRRYYGHDEGACQVDEVYAAEWAYVPHFHYDYYVYTYATSFVAASAFAEQILTQGVERYLERLLKAGSSRPPVEILQDAGVDMTTKAPIRTTMDIMTQVMDQMEEILDQRG